MAKKNSNGTLAMEVGAGLIAAGAVAAAGYYFYRSDKAKKHRKIAAAWAAKMKKEVVREAKALQRTDTKGLLAVIDRVAKTYESVRSIDPEEVKRAAAELKANWQMLQKEAQSGARRVRSSAVRLQKRAKKTVRKAKKAAKRRR